MDRLRVAVVGGSIAGCSAGILLMRAGHDVRILERSHGGLVGRGGGIGTPASLLTSLIEADVVDSDLPTLAPTSMPFTVRTSTEPTLGRIAWDMPIGIAVFHWTALWNSLRRRVPDDRYHPSSHVVAAVEQPSKMVRLELEDGAHIDADLVVWADGYQSLGRRLVCPDVDVRYRGYMLWRGLVPERHIPETGLLDGSMPRVSFPNMPGNFVAYLVPGEGGSTAPGDRLVNWGSYIALDHERVDEFMVDREGVARVGSIPPGSVRRASEERLKSLMATELPDAYSAIVTATANTSVQLIYTARVPWQHRRRMCLIGDAATIAQPFTGSGVFKGYSNVASLLEVLARHDDLDEGLGEWGPMQVALGDRLLALGEQEEQAFIWNPLDLTEAASATTAAWWNRAVQFPDDFRFERPTT
jgi:2-polyprenyl-6-methoxyphenol hydroxylase-like FAD-dependent oxidoreductase